MVPSSSYHILDTVSLRNLLYRTNMTKRKASDVPSNDKLCEETKEGLIEKPTEYFPQLSSDIDKSDPLQVYQSRKKCRKDQSMEPESDVGSENSKAFVAAENTFEKQENSGSSGKRRHSRLDPRPTGGESGEGDQICKRRKTRWTDDDSQLKMLGPINLPNFVKPLITGDEFDSETRELNKKLLEVNRKLKGSELHDDRPEEERSPSPPPVYDTFGTRINTRDFRLREKLIQDRQHIISNLIQKNPTFKPPPGYKPSRHYKKLYIPLKEYPGYNFIGLIIGPRGNTQKRLEKKTGARIVIRGKGSMKQGKVQLKPDPSDTDDLHVLVEADNKKSLDAAVRMVEKLLLPVDEGMNEHKHAQLKELAKLNGRDENLCKVCSEKENRQSAWPSQKTSDIFVSCDKCSGSTHPTANSPLTASARGSSVNRQHCSFLAELGGRGSFAFGTSPISSSILRVFRNSKTGTSPSMYSYFSPGSCTTPMAERKSNKIDDANLYVGHLPQTVGTNQLIELFYPFGRLVEVKVIKDRSTGFSKGYGFVKYDDPISAAKALAHMNGHKIEGKVLTVRVASQPSPAGSSVIGLFPEYPGRGAVSQTGWSGPRKSKLREPRASFSKNEGLCLPHSSIFLGHSDSSDEQSPASYGSSRQNSISSPILLAEFPSNSDGPGSQYPSYWTNNVSPQLHHWYLGSGTIPFAWGPTHHHGTVTKFYSPNQGNSCQQWHGSDCFAIHALQRSAAAVTDNLPLANRMDN